MQGCLMAAALIGCKSRHGCHSSSSASSSGCAGPGSGPLPTPPPAGEPGPQLREPRGLLAASLPQARRLLGFSYAIGAYRHRSFESRRMVVKYVPHHQVGSCTGAPIRHIPAAAPPACAPPEGRMPCSFPVNNPCWLHPQDPAAEGVATASGAAAAAAPGSRPPSASYLQMTYPFSSNAELREQVLGGRGGM